MSKNYAHLVSSLKAKTAEKDEDERMEDEKPPADDKEDGKKSKKAKKAEEKDDDKSAESEDEDKKDDDKKKDSKKAVVAQDGAIAEAARLEERLRCATIFSNKAAAGRLETACQFAFHTDLSADAAIAIMSTLPVGTNAEAATPAPARKSLDDRMASVKSVVVGADVDATAQPSAGSVTDKQLADMSPAQRALLIVNAGRIAQGVEPLKTLN